MAIKPQDVDKCLVGMPSIPNVNELENYIDNKLSDPLFLKRCYQHTKLKQPAEYTQIVSYEIRLPDATVVDSKILKLLEERYVAAGWNQINLVYGSAAEDCYEVRLVLVRVVEPSKAC